MYRLRFLLASEGCKAFCALGGICDQFNPLSAALNLTVTEGVSLGIAYFRIPNIRLGEMARRRAVGVDEFPRLLSFEQLGVKEQDRRGCALSLRVDLPMGSPKGGGRGGYGKIAWPRPFSIPRPTVRLPLGLIRTVLQSRLHRMACRTRERENGGIRGGTQEFFFPAL